MKDPSSGRILPRVAAWRLVDADFVVHDFGDGCVVYSPVSGNTHRVATSHVEALEFLRAAPARLEDVVCLLRGRLDLPPEEQLDVHVNLMLAMLRTMELVEPA